MYRRRYCSIECRQGAYRQRQQEAEPRYRLERSLLTAIRELRNGQGGAAPRPERRRVDTCRARAFRESGRAAVALQCGAGARRSAAA